MVNPRDIAGERRRKRRRSLTFQQHASVSQGRICSHNCTCCHTETGVADQTISLSHCILTPGQPAPVLTLYRQAPSLATTRIPDISQWCDSTRQKDPGQKREWNPGLPVSRRTLTTRPPHRTGEHSAHLKQVPIISIFYDPCITFDHLHIHTAKERKRHVYL